MNKTEFLKAISTIVPSIEKPTHFNIERIEDIEEHAARYARQQGRNQIIRSIMRRARDWADDYDWKND